MELKPELKLKVSQYQPDPAKLATINRVPLMFMVGITGAGKNALLKKLLEKYPAVYRFIVSHTTRAPRENNGVKERDGVEYHFMDMTACEHMIDARGFVEAQVIHDSWISGTSVDELLKIQQEGKIGVSDIDIQGADAYIEMGLNAKPIFILPPSFEAWILRFKGRYQDGIVPKEEMVARLRSAVREFNHALNTDHFYIVINEDLEETVDLIHEIAQGETVDPHYYKAMAIAENMLDQLRAELAKLV